MKVYDAAIIGGGPAGAAAAISLATAGCSALLLEARPMPHDKLCGEFLSPECTSLLSRLGVAEKIRGFNPATFQSATIVADDGAKWAAPLPGVAWGVSRLQLDQTLLHHAEAFGTVVHDAQACLGVSGDLCSGFDLCVRSTRTGSVERFRARVVIGAHGKRSTMDRVLKRRFLGMAYPLLAMKRHFRGPRFPEGISLFGFAGGYCGLALIESGETNVCFLVDDRTFRKCGRRADRLLAAVGARIPSLRAWLSQAEPVGDRWLSVAALALGVRGPVHGDILMVGDAAALIAPLAGDGIAMALRSGQMCAEQVLGFLQGQVRVPQLKMNYARAWNAEFLPRVRLAGLLQSLALRPIMLRACLRLFSRVPPVGRWVVRNTRSV